MWAKLKGLNLPKKPQAMIVGYKVLPPITHIAIEYFA
jgi:hypothetical protein